MTSITCFCSSHKDCKHSWEYEGKSKYYAQCPMCRCFLSIREDTKAHFDKVYEIKESDTL